MALAAAHRMFREWRVACAELGPASSQRAISDVGATPLAHLLGFGVSGQRAGTSIQLDLLSGTARVPCLVCLWAERPGRQWRDAALAARAAGSRWAFIFSGTHLRLLDVLRGPSRRWLEFDLDVCADTPECFSALWSALRAEMFETSGAGTPAPLDRLAARADARAVAVCRSLRDGVLSASADVLTAIVARGTSHDLPSAFEQSLTVVYRVLFLLFAESRALVPMWHAVYRASYSIEALRLSAERGRVLGIWDALRAISRLAHAGCRAGDLSVAPFNGRLFDASKVPLVERRDLDDEAAARAVLALTTHVVKGRGRERIAYRDLGVEQLGAVYETLLDYEPRSRDAHSDRRRPRQRPRTIVALERGSGVRKATGSFYTPQPIARYLVRQAVGPLVAGRSPAEILSLRVLDPAMGSGAFLVAACGFLAEAYESALVECGACLADDIGPSERASIHRLIAERCLFGVDLNPMAVQLARLSLWLATLARDRPLSFLDHHVRVGDSLLGASVSSLANPVGRRSKRREGRTLPLFDDAEIQRVARQVMPVRVVLAGPNDTIEQVRTKERLLAGLERTDSTLARWKLLADLWCAQWLGASVAAHIDTGTYKALADFILSGRSALPEHVARRQLGECRRVAAANRFFHWELEFPEVFFDGDGQHRSDAGFDAVVGNPPWDMMRSDGVPVSDRSQARADMTRVLRFTRDAGVYEAQSQGHANRYQLFLERSMTLLRGGGRLGLVLPGGFASDHGSASIRRRLFSTCRVDGLVGFDNRQAVFPIHRSVRFVLLTAAKGAPTNQFGVRLGEVDPGVLEQPESGAIEWFPLQLSVDLLTRVSGPGLALPDFRHQPDVVIAERAASLFPRLGSNAGWGVAFGRELNATDDREVLTARSGVPVVGGRLIEPFNVQLASAERMIRAVDAARRLGDRWQRRRLAYRDVASASNRITLIAALLPAACVSTHTVFCLRTRLPLQSQYFLCGLFNSFVVNYLVRQRVTTHVTTAVVEQLPLPRQSDGPSAFRLVAALARRLSCRPAAAARDESKARLEAVVARLYRLSADEFAHVLGTFPLVDSTDRERALAYFKRSSSDPPLGVSIGRRART